MGYKRTAACVKSDDNSKLDVSPSAHNRPQQNHQTQRVPQHMHAIHTHSARFFPSTEVFGTKKTPRSASPSLPLAGPPGALLPLLGPLAASASPPNAKGSSPPVARSMSGVWTIGGSVGRLRLDMAVANAAQGTQSLFTTPHHTAPHPVFLCPGRCNLCAAWSCPLSEHSRVHKQFLLTRGGVACGR